MKGHKDETRFMIYICFDFDLLIRYFPAGKRLIQSHYILHTDSFVQYEQYFANGKNYMV